MNDLTYSIYSGQQPVTEDLMQPITDLDDAKRLAAGLSQRQPGEAISVVSRQLGGAEARSTVARYLDGREIPVRWRVDFFGRLMDVDHVRLSKASISYLGGGSEMGPNGEIRTGLARNVVGLDAADSDDAIAKVQDALGPQASACSEWHASSA
ncbi:MAG TPA: hypothetical protein VGL68_05265 [Solirubrobacteraceae bacterium]